MHGNFWSNQIKESFVSNQSLRFSVGKLRRVWVRESRYKLSNSSTTTWNSLPRGTRFTPTDAQFWDVLKIEWTSELCCKINQLKLLPGNQLAIINIMDKSWLFRAEFHGCPSVDVELQCRRVCSLCCLLCRSIMAIIVRTAVAKPSLYSSEDCHICSTEMTHTQAVHHEIHRRIRHIQGSNPPKMNILIWRYLAGWWKVHEEWRPANDKQQNDYSNSCRDSFFYRHFPGFSWW